ncbi:MAG: circadian clock protein KaiB [Chitinophagaceae bacterium]|nr:circadian clock protein KaiB [Chitinophagaceae bacterium]
MLKKKGTDPGDSEKCVLHLYVAGMTDKSMQAIRNVRLLCEQYLGDAFDLEITDIYKNPALADKKHIVLSPSLIKTFPLPRKTLVGNFADPLKVLSALGID